MRFIALLICISFSSWVLAQEPQKFLIRTGKLFDSETGLFKSGVSILVVNSKIESLKSDKDLTAEEKKYSLIDLSNYAVLPGLIDSHTHPLSAAGLPGSSPRRVLQSLPWANLCCLR